MERAGRGLTVFTVTVKETNLFIQAGGNLEKLALDTVLSLRRKIETYIKSRPEFASSLLPVEADVYAPAIVREMIEDSRSAGTGPMSAVAGAIAEGVARVLSDATHDEEVIVENGGDVFMLTDGERVVGLHGGAALLNIGIVIPADDSGLSGVGVSSSSAHFGESLSLGGCDLATVVAKRGALSDACATALGNRVKGVRDIEGALEEIVNIPDVIGAIAMIDGKIGINGDITLVPLKEGS